MFAIPLELFKILLNNNMSLYSDITRSNNLQEFLVEECGFTPRALMSTSMLFECIFQHVSIYFF